MKNEFLCTKEELKEMNFNQLLLKFAEVYFCVLSFQYTDESLQIAGRLVKNEIIFKAKNMNLEE